MTPKVKNKIQTPETLAQIVAKLKSNGKKVVLCHGVFDLDRKSVVQGKSVDLGGRRIIKKKKEEEKDEEKTEERSEEQHV